MRKSFCLFLCLVLTLFADAQSAQERYFFRHLDVRAGLSQNTVNTILQDRTGFMWFGTKDGLNRYDGLSFRVFKHDASDPWSIGNNFITELYEDEAGDIWVGTDAGLYIYSPEKDSFRRFDIISSGGARIERSVSQIKPDNQGRIWIAVEVQGLFCYDPASRKLQNYNLQALFPGLSTNVESFAFDANGAIWVGFFGDGLYYSADQLKTLSPYRQVDTGEELFADDVIFSIISGPYNTLYIASMKQGVRKLSLITKQMAELLMIDHKGKHIFPRTLSYWNENEIWIGTESGVYIYNLRTQKYYNLNSSGYDLFSLSDKAIYSIYRDREGGTWIGSYFGGVDYSPSSSSYFEKFYPLNSNNGLQGKRVREFCRDSDGWLWIGTEDNGLSRFNPKTGEFRFFGPSHEFTNIHALCADGDYLWVGTFSKGLKRIHIKTEKIVKEYINGPSGYSFENSIFSILKTAGGDIFIGTSFGLYRYNRSADNFDRVPELHGCFVHDIKEDSSGNLWLATYAHGVYFYDVAKKRWLNYVHQEGNYASLPYNKVLSVFEDSRRQIWFTTQGGGFCKFLPDTEKFVTFNSQKGLPSDVVYQMVEDNDGFLWLSTNGGLACFDPKTEKFKVFTTANGLLSNQFNYKSSYKDDEGNIYLGNSEGFIRFNPRTFSENKFLPPAVITDFLLFNSKVRVGAPDSPLSKSITFSDEITLKASQNSFSLRLAALSYQASQMNKLMYKLEGFDEEWASVGESPLITYSNLMPGKYVFRVKASNSDGVWNDKERMITIHILPPFYLSVWAYIFYALLLIGSCFYLVYYIKKRNATRQQRQLERFEQEKEREIYRAKIEFFTNVAHEIRTPLTLIKGPLENIILKKQVDADTKEDLSIMKHNTDRLLNLTNQLLDFRKTESKGFSLNFAECNISEILRETYLRFSSLAKQKGLELTLQLSEDDFRADVDREAFIKIVSNLLNNGVKYAATYIHVFLEVEKGDQKRFRVRTVNDGLLIPAEMREEIFKPFVRINEEVNGEMILGTGIGLALARSLAELHHGMLQIDESEQDVNAFVVTLPITQDSAFLFESTRETDHEETPAENLSDAKEKRPVVLVVDDSSEMRTFLSRQLTPLYTVLTASNGLEALGMLDENYVNLIISDVMMPKMDGFELCKIIKSNLDYSHIPLILLTAKTNLQSKIEGLEVGADAYIEKPFSTEYLLVNVANLIASRENLRQSFARMPLVTSNTMALTKADEEFIRRLDEIIQEQLHNADFSMDDIADALNISRSGFYRKIRGVLDLSPNDYLRVQRLKRAAVLLKEGNSRINEIAYMVGFNSSSYFSKCFQKQFGMLPKEFQEQ